MVCIGLHWFALVCFEDDYLPATRCLRGAQEQACHVNNITKIYIPSNPMPIIMVARNRSNNEPHERILFIPLPHIVLYCTVLYGIFPCYTPVCMY